MDDDGRWKRHALALQIFGLCLHGGKGTAQNNNLAKKWFTKGSLEGDTLSMIGLAECLSKREERIESSAWLLLAKDLGEPRSLWRLEQSMAGLNAMEKKEAKEEASKLKTNLSAEPSSITPKAVRNEKQSDPSKRKPLSRVLLKTIFLTGSVKGFPRTEKFIKDPFTTEKRKDTEPCFPPKD